MNAQAEYRHGPESIAWSFVLYTIIAFITSVQCRLAKPSTIPLLSLVEVCAGCMDEL